MTIRARTDRLDDPWPTVQAIETALDVLVTAIAAQKFELKQPANPAPVPPRGWAERLPGEEHVRDPIGESLRAGVKVLGKTLYARTGSLAALSESRDRISDRDPVHADRRRAVLGKLWNGIGSGTARWNP